MKKLKTVGIKDLKNNQTDPLLLSWAEAGMITLPVIKKQPLELSPVRLPAGTAQSLLESDPSQ